MHIRKRTVFGSMVAIGAIVAAMLSVSHPSAEPAAPNASSTPETTQISASRSAVATSALQAAPAQQRAPSTSTAQRTAPQGPHITIAVGTSSYVVAASSSETVLDVMNAAKADGLTFTGENYPSLGLMVDTLGGVPPRDGYSWFLYINGKSSDVGASSARVSPGDAIEWKYEKSY